MNTSPSHHRNPRLPASATDRNIEAETPTDIRIHHSIDGLRYTIPSEAGIGNACPHHPLFEITGEVQPVNWRNYNRVIQLPHCKIAYHSDHPEWKIYVELKGQDLYHLCHAGVPAIDLLQHAIQQDANITKLDFAVDYFGPSSPQDLIDAEERGLLKSLAKRTDTHGSRKRHKPANDSRTFYLGHPKSDRYFKCYDKATQMKRQGPWTRMELTLKQDPANRAARAMLARGIGPAGKQAIRDYVWCDVDWFNQALSGPSVEMPQLDRRPPDTRGWLLNDVTRSLLKQIHADAEDGNFEIYERYIDLLEGAAETYHLAPFYSSTSK